MQIHVGSYLGDGGLSQTVSLPAGWGTPQFAIVQCVSNGGNNQAWVRMGSFASTASKPLVSNGGMVNAGVEEFEVDSFRVGGSLGSVLNDAGETYAYMVARADSGTSDSEFAFGSYVGNGFDDRDIDIGQLWTPDVVIVVRHGPSYPVWRDGSMGLLTTFFSALGYGYNRIQALQAGGFQVGTWSDVNTNGQTYSWLALKTLTGNLGSDGYTGNGIDDRDISMSDPFQPSFVWTKSNSMSPATVRWASVAGDNGQPMSGPPAPDLIQSFNADGYQIGASVYVNSIGHSYRYVAFHNRWSLSGEASLTGSGVLSADAIAAALATAALAGEGSLNGEAQALLLAYEAELALATDYEAQLAASTEYEAELALTANYEGRVGLDV